MKINPGSTVFLSGVMQGQRAAQVGHRAVAGVAVVSQEYRTLVRSAVLAADPTAQIVEPGDLVGAECARRGAPEGTAPADRFKDDAVVRRCFQLGVDAAAAADVVVS